MIAANASGNAVQMTTRMKISQTWFASQTGPSEWPMRASMRLRRSGSRSREPSSCQTPGAEVGAAEDRVERRAGREDRVDDLGPAHDPTPGLRPAPARRRPVGEAGVSDLAAPRRAGRAIRTASTAAVPSTA